MRTLQLTHLLTGTLGLLLFVASGQYMLHIVDVPQLADTERLLYRSSHIYLLLSYCLNIVAAAYCNQYAKPSKLKLIISPALLISAILLTLSFVVEAGLGRLQRPLAAYGLYLIFGASVLAVIDCVLGMRKTA